ncbi:type II secretion system F family protein [Enterobacteriaceae bacterium BIT-l23]|uniref:type II secretion system F family protein n=1 Tax=Jejubacter sp. L23 TaxID=3092086 RepID=UPI0015858B99|nr:type II secretion system F family protein [Enterobacteriaceae bacterium BIT-l23]
MTFLVMLIFGVVIFLYLVHRELTIYKKMCLVNSESQESGVVSRTTLDINAIIISNSRILLFLKEVDSDLIRKIKTTLVLSFPVFILSLLHVLPVSYRQCAMIMMVIMVATIVVPGAIVGPVIHQKLKRMTDILPYFIELTAVCVQTGMTVESSIKYVAMRFDKMDENLSAIMMSISRKAEVAGLEEALGELYHSTETPELKMFCATLQQSVHYGTSLYENLLELAHDIREYQLLHIEEKVGKLSAKMSIPLILFIMFPITILISAPGILRIMKHGIF